MLSSGHELEDLRAIKEALKERPLVRGEYDTRDNPTRTLNSIERDRIARAILPIIKKIRKEYDLRYEKALNVFNASED